MAQASAEDPLNYTLFAIKLDGFCLDPLELGLESALTLNPDGTGNFPCSVKAAFCDGCFNS